MSDLKSKMTFLLKTVHSYYDIKESVRYLIFFTNDLSCSSSLYLNITDGLRVFATQVNEISLASLIDRQQVSRPVSLLEFIEHLSQALRADKYELNKLLDPSSRDLVELRVSNVNHLGLTILAGECKSSQVEIKNLLFALHDRFSRLEAEKLSGHGGVDLAAERNSSTPATRAAESCAGDVLKKFSIRGSGSQILSRKPGMSIINPLSKRKKVPQGVKFDDDDEEEDENSGTSADENARSPKVNKSSRSQSQQNK